MRPNLHTVSHHIAKYPIIVEELHKEIARLKKLNNDTTSIASGSGRFILFLDLVSSFVVLELLKNLSFKYLDNCNSILVVFSL